MKELAREEGLLCMGPDCGVANINGAALVLASINNRGPFGICGASGTGVNQAIGVGGNDRKDEVGSLMREMGIDALEADGETKYIALISRKPGQTVLPEILARIRRPACEKRL